MNPHPDIIKLLEIASSASASMTFDGFEIMLGFELDDDFVTREQERVRDEVLRQHRESIQNVCHHPAGASMYKSPAALREYLVRLLNDDVRRQMEANDILNDFQFKKKSGKVWVHHTTNQALAEYINAYGALKS